MLQRRLLDPVPERIDLKVLLDRLLLSREPSLVAAVVVVVRVVWPPRAARVVRVGVQQVARLFLLLLGTICADAKVRVGACQSGGRAERTRGWTHAAPTARAPSRGS